MVKLEKRLAPFCENCEMFAPCSMKILNKKEGNEIDVTAIVMCTNADTCINAIHQFQKFKGEEDKESEVNFNDFPEWNKPNGISNDKYKRFIDEVRMMEDNIFKESEVNKND